ncbi:MAG: hypothetical protein GX791_08785 [Synergistaceae bacterium]|nr:hypothetical protein [Synergistaceae bacterium]
MEILSREVTIRIGKKNYFVKTALDDESLKGIHSLFLELTEGLEKSHDQENLLLISCLQLAWILQSTEKKLSEGLESGEQKDIP